MITNIPGQVERQQPVYMIDALGKASPFHPEFVRSAEVMQITYFYVSSLRVIGSDSGAESQLQEAR
jgi:hypothetical protein